MSILYLYMFLNILLYILYICLYVLNMKKVKKLLYKKLMSFFYFYNYS
nr:MAG TPA: hypothetical protein [Caudoviricetes sp.]